MSSERRVKADLVIRNIGQLLTLSGNSERPVTHPVESSLGIMGSSDSGKMCVATKGDAVCFVGALSELGDFVDSSRAVEVDARNRLVIPGFVDCHTHAVFAGSRQDELADKLGGMSYLEILAKGGGILRTVRDTRKASDSEISLQTRERLQRMLSFGTTTCEVKTGYGLDVKNEIRLLRIIRDLTHNYDIVPTLLSAHAVPPEFSGRVHEYIEQVVKPTIDEASKNKLATFCDVFLEEGVFGIEESREILEYARAKGMLTKLHADEFNDIGGAALAAKLMTVSADHLMRASSEGTRELARAGVVPVLLPGTSFSSLVSSYADARRILGEGGAVALATDLCPNAWVESMQFIVSLACYVMRMTPPEAIVASTINAAHALKRGKDVGSIEVGKKCDVLIMNLADYKEIPYRIAGNNVSTVIRGGKIVVSAQANQS